MSNDPDDFRHDAYRSEEPVDRMTHLGDQVMDFLKTTPLYHPGDKIIISVHGAENIGGMAILGYETDQELVEDMQEYLRRILHTMGKDVIFTRMTPN